MFDPSKDPDRSSKPGLRMKDLMEASGLPKSTILYYVSLGLLPEPVKTSHNMAYYDPRCVAALRYIRNLQQRHRLSLSEIRKMLKTRGADLSVYVELNDIIFGSSGSDELLGEGQFRRETGLSEKQLQELLESKLMMPLVEGTFDRDDVSIGKTFARLLGKGLAASDLTYYVALGDKIVDCEMSLRRRLTHHLPDDKDASLSLELVRHARMTRSYVIDRLFQHRVAGMRDLKEKNPAAEK
jgi:DNA-binding transcriptional MerR regulator